MKANEIMKHYDICRVTLCRWVRDGKIVPKKLPSGRYDYVIDELIAEKQEVINQVNRKTIIYSRVSTSGQSDNLDRQIDRLRSFASARGYIVDAVYSEIASALNYNRKKYRKLYNEVVNGEIERVIVEYKDRLLRIGFDDFKSLCDLKGVDLVVIDESNDKSKQQEIIDDMISIIHHFSARIYSSRKRKKLQDVITFVEQDKEETEE